MIRSSDSGNFWWQIDAFLNDTVDQMQYYYGMNIYSTICNVHKMSRFSIFSKIFEYCILRYNKLLAMCSRPSIFNYFLVIKL